MLCPFSTLVEGDEGDAAIAVDHIGEPKRSFELDTSAGFTPTLTVAVASAEEIAASVVDIDVYCELEALAIEFWDAEATLAI